MAVSLTNLMGQKFIGSMDKLLKEMKSKEEM